MSTTQETTSDKVSIFEDAIDGYIRQINSLIDTMPIVLNILASNTIMHIDKVNEFVFMSANFKIYVPVPLVNSYISTWGAKCTSIRNKFVGMV